MKTFSIQTLGCKVNQYESEQISALLRSRGLRQTVPDHADLRIINTCSVTVQAASQSRQGARRLVRLQQLPSAADIDRAEARAAVLSDPAVNTAAQRPRIVVTGCWATSDRDAAATIPGVDAVITHHDDVGAQFDRLLNQWDLERHSNAPRQSEPLTYKGGQPTDATPARSTHCSKSPHDEIVNVGLRPPRVGTTHLPLLGDRQIGRQRAFLKVQDGCDAHCTYCIIPRLRPTLWSKSLSDVVREARTLVDSGHVEIILTGIFLGAYGQPTALRRRQPPGNAVPLEELIAALCTGVPGLARLRISSLEPGDLNDHLLGVMRSHEQVVPHFHLPLQSGSDTLLRRMNRQYGRDDFLRMLDRVESAFDRPALTTDVIVGFPGEDDEEFRKTVEVVERARFIHVHAFPFSPRPGTAAARWSADFIRGPIVNQRVEHLRQMGEGHSLRFRSSFLGQEVRLIIEHDPGEGRRRHGRCERYFSVDVNEPSLRPGDQVRVRVTEVNGNDTTGVLQHHEFDTRQPVS